MSKYTCHRNWTLDIAKCINIAHILQCSFSKCWCLWWLFLTFGIWTPIWSRQIEYAKSHIESRWKAQMIWGKWAIQNTVQAMSCDGNLGSYNLCNCGGCFSTVMHSSACRLSLFLLHPTHMPIIYRTSYLQHHKSLVTFPNTASQQYL